MCHVGSCWGWRGQRLGKALSTGTAVQPQPVCTRRRTQQKRDWSQQTKEQRQGLWLCRNWGQGFFSKKGKILACSCVHRNG